jgi:hypothetical protein
MAANEIEIRVKMNDAGAVTEIRRFEREVDNSSRRIGQSGQNGGRSFAERFLAGLKAGSILTGITAGLASLPAVMGASGVLAGIALGAGILVGTKKSQGPLYGAFHQFLGGLLPLFRQAARPLITPLIGAFADLRQIITGSVLPGLRQVFKAIAPDIAPVVQGIGSLVRGVLPGFITLMKAAGPAVRNFSKFLGMTGDGLGGLFKALAPAVRPASQIFRALGSILKNLLPPIGKIISVVSQALGPAFKIIGRVAKAFGNDIGDIMPSLRGLGRLFATVLKNLIPMIPSWARLTGAMLKLLNAGLKPLLPPLTRLLNAIMPPLVKFINLMSNAFAKNIGPLSQVAAWVGRVIGKLLDIIAAASKVGAKWQTFTTGLSAAWGTVTSTISSLWDATIGSIISGIETAIGLLGSLTSKIGSIGGGIGGILSHFGLAHGGTVGQAASGGIRGSLVKVGEHGRELVRLPVGSTVFSNPDTERMLGQGGGGTARVVIEYRGGSGMTGLDHLFWTWMQRSVRIQGGDPAMFQRKVAFR